MERSFIRRVLGDGRTGEPPSYDQLAPLYLNETFSPDWYRRPTPCSLADVVPDVLDLFGRAPTPSGKALGLGNFVPVDFNLSSLSVSATACLLKDVALGLGPGQFSPVVAANFDLVQAFWSGAVAPLFEIYNCDAQNYTNPGPSVGNLTPGVNASGEIVNGYYP